MLSAIEVSLPSARRFNTIFVASPPVVVDHYICNDKSIYIVRDDLLPGGTKQRGLFGLLKDYERRGYGKFAYVSPFCGYAQVALSYLCMKMGLKCVLFCERDLSQSLLSPHPYTAMALEMGAEIHLFDSLKEAQASVKRGHPSLRDALQIPLGFDCPEFTHHYTEALKVQWTELLERLPGVPAVLWLPVGSGTLIRNFVQVLRKTETRIAGVDVHVLESNDRRVRDLQKLENVKMYSARQKFQQCETELPPFPSNVFYDAKVHRFVAKYSSNGDVWWNVAR